MDKFLEKKIKLPTQRTTRLGKRSFFYNILESNSQSLEQDERQIAATYKATMSLIAEAQVFLSFEKTPSQGGGDKQIGGTSLWDDEPEEQEGDTIYKDITSSYINDADIII
jgi:hypothetical protein